MKKIILASFLFALSPVKNAFSATFIPSDFDKFEKTKICNECDLTEIRLVSKNMPNIEAKNSFFSKAMLEFSKFQSSNFSGANFNAANLMESSFSGSDFTDARLDNAYMSKGNFSSCDFTGASLSGADLSNANFARAKVSLEQLSKAKSLSCAIMPDGTRYSSDKNSRCL